ncbi:unnamed protein product, partial [Phaeothamnion confervicola]
LLRKDDNALKLFVGQQVPKAMDETALRPILQEFGDIFDLAVIRDKQTGVHRGCAFVTFCQRASAEACIAALHGQRKLPGAQNPLQVRAAEGQAERENKLFVGMVPKAADEDAIRAVFAQFGDIREVHVIRNTDGSNKGCAFVKFVDRGAALEAIDALHEKCTMEGGPRPLVVKFADNKRGVQLSPGGGNPGSGGSVGGGSVGHGGGRTPQHGGGGGGGGDSPFWPGPGLSPMVHMPYLPYGAASPHSYVYYSPYVPPQYAGGPAGVPYGAAGPHPGHGGHTGGGHHHGVHNGGGGGGGGGSGGSYAADGGPG